MTATRRLEVKSMQPLEREFKFEGFTLDLRPGSLRGAGGEIELRPKSFKVFRYLVENAVRLVPKDELIKAVWPNVVVTDESLTRCVSDVRLTLGDRRQRIIRPCHAVATCWRFRHARLRRMPHRQVSAAVSGPVGSRLPACCAGARGGCEETRHHASVPRLLDSNQQ
jgi:hypothetical protein